MTPRSVGRSLAAAALCLALPAQAAAQACVSEADIGAMAAFALPSAVGGLIEHCGPNLPADGFLGTQGPNLVARYASGKQAAWPAAKRAFLQMANEKDAQALKAVKGLPDEALQPFVEGMIASLIGTQLKPDQCALAERIVRLLAPLPAENVAELVGLLVRLGSKGKKAPGDLVLCPQ